MATPLSAARLLHALLDEGLDVVQVGDWRTHNRNHTGSWGPVNGVMIHHTVTSGSARTVDICRHGYAGLPGPLCHGVITKDGRVHLIGHGRANHAGLGDDDVLQAVIDERALPADNETSTDGNRHFYGFECENLGDGKDPWPAVQLEAIEKASAAICRLHQWDAASVIGHLEWQPGKIDPRGFTMASMRARIADRLDNKPPKPSTPPSPPSTSGTYTVRKGDTLSAIATAHKTTVAKLASLNGIKDPDQLAIGQKLKVRTTAAPAKPKRPSVDLSKLIAAARSNPTTAGTPVTYSGVRTVETALVDAGLLSKKYSDGHFGTTTVAAYAKWQRSKAGGGYSGSAADGIPGKASLTALGKKHGFTVTN